MVRQRITNIQRPLRLGTIKRLLHIFKYQNFDMIFCPTVPTAVPVFDPQGCRIPVCYWSLCTGSVGNLLLRCHKPLEGIDVTKCWVCMEVLWPCVGQESLSDRRFAFRYFSITYPNVNLPWKHLWDTHQVIFESVYLMTMSWLSVQFLDLPRTVNW
jgi:hypothetical protein